MNKFAFSGGFLVVASGIIAYYVTGQWTVLGWGIAGLLLILVLLSGRK